MTLPSHTLRKVFAAFTAVSAFVTLLAFLQPLEKSEDAKVIYSLAGKFDYSANAHDSDLIYADSQVSTGDPIYTSVVNDVLVVFKFNVTTFGKFKGGGTIDMKMVLTGRSGWAHTFPLNVKTTFDGTGGRVSTVVNLKQMADYVRQASQLTKVTDPTYDISFIADVKVDGNISGAPLQTNYSSTFKFSGDALKLTGKTVGTDNPTTANAAPPVGANKDAKTGDGMLTVKRSGPTVLRLLGLSIAIAALRLISLTGLGIGLAGLLATTYAIRRRTTVADLFDEAVSKYQSMLVEQDAPKDATPVVHDTTSRRTIVPRDRFGADRNDESTPAAAEEVQ
jgi:hypothetical protein